MYTDRILSQGQSPGQYLIRYVHEWITEIPTFTPTVLIPTVLIPTFHIPTVIPTVHIPTFHIPTVLISTFHIPTVHISTVLIPTVISTVPIEWFMPLSWMCGGEMSSLSARFVYNINKHLLRLSVWKQVRFVITDDLIWPYIQASLSPSALEHGEVDEKVRSNNLRSSSSL